MYQHILLAVALQRWESFTPHALAAREAAVTLAKGSGAKLSVLSVSTYDDQKPEELPPPMEIEMASHHEETVRHQLEAARKARGDHMRRVDALMEEKMRAFLAETPAADIPITSVLKEGDPRQLIIQTAEILGVDLIVIGAHSKRSFLDVLLGGTAAYVSRHAPCPVVMVKPGEQHQPPMTA